MTMTNRQRYETRKGSKQRIEFSSGMRVRMKCDDYRYPFFVLKEGMTGTVVSTSTRADGALAELWVEMDDHIDGCESWDNCVVWSDCDLADSASVPWNDLEVIQ